MILGRIQKWALVQPGKTALIYNDMLESYARFADAIAQSRDVLGRKVCRLVLTGRLGAYVGPQLKWEGRPKGSPVEVDLAWLPAVGANRNEARSQVRLGARVGAAALRCGGLQCNVLAGFTSQVPLAATYAAHSPTRPPLKTARAAAPR